ncbi:MAG: hypothetical protein GY847_28815 [Proteobacteria bacterium]|nr:hypothetical protein [Pseudomonadota bacterium]
MKDARLTKTDAGYYDLLIENGSTQWTDKGTAIAQHAMMRLLIFKGEYALGVLGGKDDDGLDWYGIMFDMSKSKNEKELELKRVVLQTPGIERIIYFNWTQAGYTVTIDAAFQTIYGAATVSETITPL